LRFGFETASCALPNPFVDELKPIYDAMGIDLSRPGWRRGKADRWPRALPFGSGA